MKIAVVDDDVMFLKEAIGIIHQHCCSKNINHIVHSFDDGFSILSHHHEYDVIFLDIDMPIIDGLDVAKEIMNENISINYPAIVFVTSKDNLVFEALKQYPFSFIRKAFFKSDIGSCLSRIYSILKEDMHLYPIKTGRSIINIKLSDIIYVVKENNYVVFHSTNMQYKERSTITEKISDLDSFGFLRPNIGYIVNFRYIKELNKKSIVLANDLEIVIGRRYLKEFKEKYHRMVVNCK